MAGTQFGIPPKNIGTLDYTGADLALTPVVEADRAPTVNDKNYPIDCYWRNRVTRDLWWLSGFDSTGALWIKLTNGASGPMLSVPVPLGTSPVVPDGAGALTFTSTLGSIAITGGLNTINFDLTGGGIAIDTNTVDTFTAPAVTATVAPTALGDMRIRGAQVAAGTNPVRTNSHAVSDWTTEVQISQAVASPNTNNNGLSHFDAADFQVQSNGFVSLNGTGVIFWQTIIASQALAVNNGYMCIAPGGALVLTLPVTPAIGDTIEVLLDGATSWQVVAGAGDVIRLGNVTTSAGGTITSTLPGDWIRLVAQSASRWNAFYNGNFSYT